MGIAEISWMMFQDRTQAGIALGNRIKELVKSEPMLVLALPRGGVPVGFEVARILKAPLDIFMVRKLGVPGHEELAMGALASGGVRLLDYEVIHVLAVPPSQVEEVTQTESQELARRSQLYRWAGSALPIAGKKIVVVDDGIATGWTMSAAIEALRKQGAREIIVGVPVAPQDVCRQLERRANAVICLHAPLQFLAVGEWYRDFSQTSDDEVRDLLVQARRTSHQAA